MVVEQVQGLLGELQGSASSLINLITQHAHSLGWRGVVGFYGRHLWAQDIVDGTPRGNEWIERIMRIAGSPMEDYDDGRRAWCGLFAQCLYRIAGFNTSITIASVGKLHLVYAQYKPQHLKGSPRYAVDLAAGGVVQGIREMHEEQNRLRIVGKPGEMIPSTGDLLVHVNPDNPWHGHVMPVFDYCPDRAYVLTVEGNSTQARGPDGKQRDGVGCRFAPVTDPYFDAVIRPSDLDFAPWIRYFPRKRDAERFAGRLTEAQVELALSQQETVALARADDLAREALGTAPVEA